MQTNFGGHRTNPPKIDNNKQTIALAGISGQSTAIQKPIIVAIVVKISDVDMTIIRTKNPTVRDTRLSTRLRNIMSKEPSDCETMRFQGENSVASKMGTENICIIATTLWPIRFTVPNQPGPYHQYRNSSNISSIVHY